MGKDAPTVSARRERACASDHLQAVARVFHPHRDPRFDWDRHAWTWVPPWQDPDTPDHAAEVLGVSWGDAAAQLQRLAARLRCPHGTPTVHRCPTCRAQVVAQLTNTSKEAAA